MDLAPLLVRASAGTGKTYALSGRLLSVLLAGAEVESILATTFTRKAAGEILQRILVTLARAADEPDQLDALRTQTGQPRLAADDCRKLLHRLIRDIHRLRVCTLDSLFSQMARSFPFELRLPPAWRLSDEIEEVWIRRRALDAMLDELDTQELSSLLAMLSKGESARSVDYELQGIVTDAYSDSRWCELDAWLTLEVPDPPESHELGRAASLLMQAAVGHRSADQMLRRIGEELEGRRWDALAAIKLVLDIGGCGEGEGFTYYRREIPDDVMRAVRLAFHGVRTESLGLLKLQTEATGKLLSIYGRHVEGIKHHTRVFGFDDVAFRLARWIEGTDLEALAARMDGAISHVLLDEFQDTAPAQWAVLRPLAIRAAADPPRSTFFCVGDTKQAIYGWRGGRAAIFDAVAHEVPGAKQTSQDLSYRSSPVITSFVTRLFQNLNRHPTFSEMPERCHSKEDFETVAIHRFASQFPVHRSAKESLPGHVRLMTGPGGEGESGRGGSSGSIAHLRYAADVIRSLAEEAPGRSIGVLTRTNRTVAQTIFMLKRLGVDVSQEGGNPLTDSALVEVVLSALAMAEHPGDQRWAFHVSHSPLGQHVGLPPIHPSMATAERLEAIDLAATRVRDQVEYAGLPKAILWLAEPLIAIASSADATRLKQLLSLAHAYETHRQPRLSSFIDYVRFKRVERPRPAQVRVMTVHQAKGLEFDSVVLPELDSTLTRMGRKIITRSSAPTRPPDAILRYVGADQWNMLPTEWREAFGENAANMMTEALCLLYVAVTRPRHALHMIIGCGKQSAPKSRTPAALIYHALGCETDASQPRAELYAAGSATWFE